MDVEMDTQINVGVIEVVGTGAPEATATSGGVLTYDVGGGGGAVPSVAKAARGEVDEPVEEVIGSIVGGSTVKATGGMVAAPTTPRAGGAGGASDGEGLHMHDSDTILNDCVWDTIIQAQERTVRSAYDLNMAIYSSFAKVRFGSIAGTFIISPTFPRTGLIESMTIELEEKWDPIWLRKSREFDGFLGKHVEIAEFIGKLFWVIDGNHRLNQFAFQAHTLVHDIEHLRFIGMLSLEEVQTLYNREAKPIIKGERASFFKNARGDEQQKEMEWHTIEQQILNTKRTKELVKHRRNSFTISPKWNGWLPCGGTSLAEFKNQLGLPFLVRRMVYRYLKYCPGAPVYTAEALSDYDNHVVEVQQLNTRVHTQETIQKMPNPNTVEPKETVMEILAQEILVPAPRNPKRGRREAFHENVLQMMTWKSSPLQLCINKLVHPLSPTVSVGEVVVLIGDYTQLLDATSGELYMLDPWIYGLGQLTPYGKINFIFFDLPDGMPPPQGNTPSWNVVSSFMIYEGVVVMILLRSLMWEGLLAHLAHNDDGFLEFSFGCLLSSIAVDTKDTSRQKRKVYSWNYHALCHIGNWRFGSMVQAVKETGQAIFALDKEGAFEDILRRFCDRSTLITHSVSVHMLDLDDMDDHMDRSQFHLPIYTKYMAQHYIQHKPIVKEHSTIPISTFLDMEAEED
ncbi:hypothetical protein SELMODRAFT_407210 [Selaginella moellendorffii]|uniref:Uncharacterized protein n=1 Tax=Selaginella moellendorffii TaxID=88036 RepID=D8R499_SELML|nr:hypothetical protein SELMODRAFT_407210 [Selaginella moellendorffii]